MKFLRSIGLAALLMVGASSASAQVYYDMTQMTSQSGYRSEIYETVTTADFLRAPANGVQRLAFTRGSAFTATVYACETKSPAVPATAATCTSVATLSATNPSILVTTGRAWLIVDVTAAETAGNVSYLTIRSHSTQQLSGGSGSTVDTDGDGLFEYMKFPSDYDGDGTVAIVCTAARTPDEACAFAGEKVWPDMADDINAAVDQLAAGGTLECAGDWILPFRPKVCGAGGTREGLSCNHTDECGAATCDFNNNGYLANVSYPSGKRRTVASSVLSRHPTLNKTGMTFTGSGPDIMGEKDGHRAGCWLVNDSGSHPNGTNGVDQWMLGMGARDPRNTDYGETLVDEAAGATVISEAFGPGEPNLCLCNATACTNGTNYPDRNGWVTANLNDGDWIKLSFEIGGGATYISDGNTAVNQALAHIKSVGPATCDSNNGIMVELVPGDFADAAAGNTVDVFKVRPEMLAQNITLEHFTLSPQNPFPQIGYGSDALLSSECTAWDGTTLATDAGMDPDCDTSGMVGMFNGIMHSVTDNAFLHASAMDPAVIDGNDGCTRCRYHKNYIGPGRVAGSILDTGTGWEITENVFDGCVMTESSTASCMRVLGDNTLIARNLFQNVGALRCNAGTNINESCTATTDCAGGGSCEGTANRWISLKHGSNRIVDNDFVGGAIGITAISIEEPDQHFLRNRVTGVAAASNDPFMIIGQEGPVWNIRVEDNKFMHRSQVSNANFGGWIQIQNDASAHENISISGNVFTDTTRTAGGTDFSAPIRIQTDNAGGSKYQIVNNIVDGYDRAVNRLGPVFGLVTAPFGDRSNLLSGLLLTDRGGATGAAATALCTVITVGDAWTISDGTGSACTGGTTDTYCYCNGSALVVGP